MLWERQIQKHAAGLRHRCTRRSFAISKLMPQRSARVPNALWSTLCLHVGAVFDFLAPLAPALLAHQRHRIFRSAASQLGPQEARAFPACFARQREAMLSSKTTRCPGSMLQWDLAPRPSADSAVPSVVCCERKRVLQLSLLSLLQRGISDRVMLQLLLRETRRMRPQRLQLQV